MAKSKRKNTIVAVREPNGRLSRSTMTAIDACSPAQVRRLRDAALAGMRHSEWGTELGRLFLDGKLEAPLFEAGKRWARLSARARAILLGPKKASTASAFVPKNGGHDPDPDSLKGKNIAAKERLLAQEFAEAHGALLGAGMMAERVVRYVCEDDIAPSGYAEVMQLEYGLSWLAQHWGLTAVSKNVRWKS